METAWFDTEKITLRKALNVTLSIGVRLGQDRLYIFRRFQKFSWASSKDKAQKFLRNMPASALSFQNQEAKMWSNHMISNHSLSVQRKLHYTIHNQEEQQKAWGFWHVQGILWFEKICSHIKRAIHWTLAFSKPTLLDMNISDTIQHYWVQVIVPNRPRSFQLKSSQELPFPTRKLVSFAYF